MEIPSSGDQYNLKWNNHLANFVQTFIEHQNQESLVDVTLSCEGQYIKAHKLILSACSDYFHSIFQVHGSVSQPFILLNGVKFSDLKYILHFMYHGEVKVVDKDLPSVLALGESLQIKGLSSVKLRDMPADEEPSHQNLSKNSPHKNVHSQSYTPSAPLPSEAPYNIPKSTKVDLVSTKASIEYSSNKPHHLTSQIQNKTVQEGNFTQEIHTLSCGELPLKKMLVETESSPGHGGPNNKPHSTNITVSREIKNSAPKPPHAFMIFANEFRKKLTVEHPEENNKEISVRLGIMWKNLLPKTKENYYAAAERAEQEHRAKYPNYVHVSNEVSKRKADVLNDSANAKASLDLMEVVETQEQICLSDSE